MPVLIGSYNANHGRRGAWAYVGYFSGFLLWLPLYAVIMWPGLQSLGLAVMAWVTFLMILYLYLFNFPWCVELTADEFRWHTLLRTWAVPLSRVRSVRRGNRNTVLVRIDGRRLTLVIEARPGRLGTLAHDIKAAAPHVTIVPPGL